MNKSQGHTLPATSMQLFLEFSFPEGTALSTPSPPKPSPVGPRSRLRASGVGIIRTLVFLPRWPGSPTHSVPNWQLLSTGWQLWKQRNILTVVFCICRWEGDQPLGSMYVPVNTSPPNQSTRESLASVYSVPCFANHPSTTPERKTLAHLEFFCMFKRRERLKGQEYRKSF